MQDQGCAQHLKFPVKSQKPQCARGTKQEETSCHLCPGPTKLYRLKVPVWAKTHCQTSDRTNSSLVIVPPEIFAELSIKQFLISLLPSLPEMQSFGNSQVSSQFPGTRGKVSAVHVHSLRGSCRVLTASPNPTVQPWPPSSSTSSMWWMHWMHPGCLRPTVHKWWRRFVCAQEAPHALNSSDSLSCLFWELTASSTAAVPPCTVQFLIPCPLHLAQTPACSQLGQTHRAAGHQLQALWSQS